MIHRFICSVCEKTIVHESIHTTGYVIDSQTQAKICFACCAAQDKETMISEGTSKRIPLYLSENPPKEQAHIKSLGVYANSEVTNWPGTLRFPSWCERGKHNIAGTRMDAWFDGPDGYRWHGVQYGEMTQIIHCKRTKVRWKEEDWTKVIFRKWQGKVIALFPELPGTNNPYTCMSYMHIGQHSACDPDMIIGASKPAKEEEYQELKQELESIGYTLRVITRNRHWFADIRRDEIRRTERGGECYEN